MAELGRSSAGEPSINCGVCHEVIYREPAPGMGLRLANHNITVLPDGRCQWYSRDFRTVVHLCLAPAIEGIAQNIITMESARAFSGF